MPEVDPRQVQAQATLPPAGAMDSNGAIPTQGANVDATLQTPTAAAPTQPMSLVAPTPPPPVATSKNPALHNLIGSVLGGLAGHPPPRYSYDDNGKLIVTAAPPQSSADKIRTIAANALTGLSAAGTRPQGKSGLASLLTGAGAGAEAVEQKAAGEDVLKRAQAKESFEQEQQAKLRQHEIARQNALTLSTYYGAKKAANDMDPHFAQNESLFNAVKASPELGAHATEMSDTQVEQEAAKDPTFATTHIIKPLGWAPETDPATGQQVEVNGEPKFYMRMAVVNGTKDGKITVTPEMAADAKMYGPMARIPNAGDIKAGDTYDLGQLLPMMNKIDEQRKSVLDGWQKSEVGWVTDPKTGKGTAVETNKVIPYGMEGRTRPLIAKPATLEAEEGKTALEKAQAREADAKAKEALANAAMIAGGSITNDGDFTKSALPDYMNAVAEVQKTNPAGYAILRNVPPIYQKAVLLVANGDATVDDATKNPRKGVPVITPLQMEGYAAILNPRWTKQMYTAKKDASEDMIRKNGDAIKSFGQFFVHADDARMASEALQRTNSPWLNEPMNKIKSGGLGLPQVNDLHAAILAARSEWMTFIKNNHAADLADTEESRKIMSDASSPSQIMGALKTMGNQAVGRLDQIDAIWRRTWGGHYPGLVSNSAREAATHLGLGDAIKQYPVEAAGGMFGAREGGYGQPAGSSQSGQPKSLTNIHSDGKTTIGWDGTQWVDQTTNQPYKAAGAQ